MRRLLLGLLLALPLPALASPGLFVLAGSWAGAYHCAQGNTALELDISLTTPRTLQALFYFHALPKNPYVPSGCFLMSGTFNAQSGGLQLRPTKWLYQPPFFVPVALTGMLNPNGTLTGQIFGPGCTDFMLTRQPAPQAPARCTPPLGLATS